MWWRHWFRCRTVCGSRRPAEVVGCFGCRPPEVSSGQPCYGPARRYLGGDMAFLVVGMLVLFLAAVAAAAVVVFVDPGPLLQWSPGRRHSTALCLARWVAILFRDPDGGRTLYLARKGPVPFSSISLLTNSPPQRCYSSGEARIPDWDIVTPSCSLFYSSSFLVNFASNKKKTDSPEECVTLFGPCFLANQSS